MTKLKNSKNSVFLPPQLKDPEGGVKHSTPNSSSGHVKLNYLVLTVPNLK